MKKGSSLLDSNKIVKNFVINEHLAVALNDVGEIGITIDDNWIAQCHHVILTIHDDNDKEIYSMDEAIEKLRLSNEEPLEIKLSKKTEFMAHASNIQAWVENGYDPRLLDSRLATGILFELSKIDEMAKNKLENIMIERFIETPADHQAWFFENYYEFLMDELIFPIISRLLKSFHGDSSDIHNLTMSFTKFIEGARRKKLNEREIIQLAIDNARFIKFGINHHSLLWLLYLQKKDILKIIESITIHNFSFAFGNTRSYASNKLVEFMLLFIKMHKRDVINAYMENSNYLKNNENNDSLFPYISYQLSNLIERVCYILSFEDADYTSMFTKEDIEYLDNKFSEFNNARLFLKYAKMKNRENRRHDFMEQEGKKIYGKDWQLSKEIREHSESIVTSPEIDWITLVYALGWFSKVDKRMTRAPKGATDYYTYYDFNKEICDFNEEIKIFVVKIFRVESEGKVSFLETRINFILGDKNLYGDNQMIKELTIEEMKELAKVIHLKRKVSIEH